MKLIIFIVAALAIYSGFVFHFVRQYRLAETQEEKENCMLGKMLFALTLFFGVLIWKTISLTIQGVLPLL